MAVKYDKDIDYQALINEAVGKGDYRSAAQYEQQRNAKINDLNATGTNKWNAEQTNKYAGWLDNTDYAAQLKDMMAAGANAQEVSDVLGKRVHKASSTEGMTKYVYDDVYKEAMDYITNYTQKPIFSTSAYEEDRPSYTSSYSSQIDSLLNEILNREDFSYDAASDPLYQQYQKQYQREGQRSMNDTLASVASSAGGMNSYAITAAQQANDYYAAQLGDKIPELYQMAYDMYLNDKASKVEDLGLLQQMDNTQYGRYRDTMSDWRDDRDFAYTKYRDDMGDYHWGKNFQHDLDVFEHNQNQDFITNDHWDKTFEAGENDTVYNRVMDMLDSGVMPDEALLKQAGISKEQAQAYIDNGYGYNREQNDIVNNTNAQNDAFDRAMEMLQDGIMPSDELLKKAGIPADEAKKAVIEVAQQAVNNKNVSAYKSPSGDDYEDDGDGDGYTMRHDPYADTRSEIASEKADSTKLSDGAMKKLKSLESMQGMIGSKDGIANSIAVYADSGDITMAEAEYMFRYFGYDPKDWIEY